MAPKPGKPEVALSGKGSTKKGLHVSIKWWPPQTTDNIEVEEHEIWYYEVKNVETRWEQKKFENNAAESDPTKKIKSFVYVKPNTYYIFHVKAKFDDDSESLWSEPSAMLSTDAYSENEAVSLKSRVLAKSELVTAEKKRPSIYQISLKKDYVSDDGMLRKYHHGKKNYATEKVLMIVGATGSGKSTLINVMINYLFGIKRGDSERLRLIDEAITGTDQAKSQTSTITAYTIYSQEGLKVPNTTITIIDTPGFGDTSGIKRDDEITEQISRFFKSKEASKGIDHIDVVGFVTQASLPRLTPTQRYIFDKILGLFGKDIERNIMMLCTFADAKTPQVLSGIKSAGFPHETYFKFNNSAMFSQENTMDGTDEGDDVFDELFWAMGEKSLEQFFDSLKTCMPQTLTLTKKVLDERLQLEMNIEHIHTNIKTGLNVLEQLRREIEVVSEHDDKIKKNEDFTYTVEVVEMVRRQTSQDKYTTTCTICNETCHDDCDYKDDAKKRKCKVMNRAGDCTVCPKRCSYKKHKHLPYVMVQIRRQELRTSEDLKKRYQEGVEGKLTQEKLIEEMTQEFETYQADAVFLADQCRQTVAKLNEIALRPNPMSTPEYIDMMIEMEKTNPSRGFQERINELLNLRKRAEVFADMIKGGKDPYIKFKEFIKAERERAETPQKGKKHQ